MKFFSILIVIMMVFSTVLFSQLPPTGFIPLQYNGSFAGMAGQSRLILNANQVFNDLDGYGIMHHMMAFSKS